MKMKSNKEYKEALSDEGAQKKGAYVESDLKADDFEEEFDYIELEREEETAQGEDRAQAEDRAYGKNKAYGKDRAADTDSERETGLEYIDIDGAIKDVIKGERKKSRLWMVVRRTALVIVTVFVLLLFSLAALLHTLLTGPSETMRDQVVLSAMQASATKWLPGLFLEDALVEEICQRSADVQEQMISMEVFVSGADQEDSAQESADDGKEEAQTDEWADAVDGMIYKTYSGSTFKAYILLVKDPSRVYVGTSSDYKSGKIGIRIFDIVERENAVAAINAGEFADTNGQGTGDTPIGLTYSRGDCVWDDGNKRTFIGFDGNNVLHAFESMTREKADEMGIRDAVSFQTGNVLITNDHENVTLYYAEGNIGMAQRTAIGQRADGAVILVVTDGRTASSLGATRNDVIDLLVSEGAVVAGMLDGGSSAMMYYRDYYTKYDIDTAGLDEYQRQGLTNRYKAFTRPRHMPTFFLVAPEE